MTLWLVKFYYKEIVKVFDGFDEKGFFLFKRYEEKSHFEQQDKEIHACFVKTEEEADMLVRNFQGIITYAKKYEMKG